MYDNNSLTPSLSSEATLELLGDNKLNSFSDRERRSLAMLKDGNKKGPQSLVSYNQHDSNVTHKKSIDDRSSVFSPSSVLHMNFRGGTVRFCGNLQIDSVTPRVVKYGSSI